MRKLPVGATIAQAYRFAFSDFLKVLGRIWVPWAIMSGLGLFFIPALIRMFEAFGRGDFGSALHQSLIFIPFLIVACILYCSQIVSIVQLALQPSREQVPYHFSLGKPVWRLLGAYLLAIPVYLLALVAVVVTSAIVGFVFGMLAALGNAKVMLGLTVAGSAFVAYAGITAVTIRAVWLIAPITVAEQKGSLGRAWTASRGNFWRLLLVLLAITLPFWILQRVMIFALTPHGMMMSAPPDASAEVKAAVTANVMNWAANMLSAFLHYWYITYPLGLVWTAIYLGMIFGGQAFSYSALTQTDGSAPVAAD